MESISHYITPLLIIALGHTHTYRHPHKTTFKPDCWPAHAWFKNCIDYGNP